MNFKQAAIVEKPHRDSDYIVTFELRAGRKGKGIRLDSEDHEYGSGDYSEIILGLYQRAIELGYVVMEVIE